MAIFITMLWQQASMAAPSITGFSPSFGQPGNVITISGSGFSTTTNVTFNNGAPTLADFEIVSDSVLLTVVPVGATTGPLSVSAASGTATTSSNFSVAPMITGFTPGLGAAGTQVYIAGANFIVGATSIVFSGTNTVVKGTVTASTVVNAVVPQGASNGPVTVITTAGSVVSTNNFIVSSAPLITDFSPTSGASGASVVIDGANFVGGMTVKFNGTSSSSVGVTSSTQLTATVPSGAGTGPITVSTGNGSFTTTSNFASGNSAIITGFSPTSGITGTTVTISGVDLYPETGVTFSGKSAAVTGYTSTSLQVVVPTNSGVGPIEVLTSSGDFTTSTNFTNYLGPVITNFAPQLGPPGTTVTLNGIDFATGDTVKFGGVAASASVTASSQISATVPSGAPTGPITVGVGSYSSATTSNFTVTGSGPVITSVTPPNGVRGQTITINGANFSSGDTVGFNGTAATFLPPTSTTVLYAIVPATATTGLITVDSASSPAIFYLQPWITNFTPSGIVNSSLTIVGRNLSGATSVTVNGVNYSFTDSPTTIVATVPSNAISGPVVITTPGGVIISTNSFLVLPKIYSFSPTLGPAGTIVTIDGTSLFNVSSVEFGGVGATPFNVTTNQLQVAVPSGAVTGPITVITPSGSDVSSNIFTVTHSSLVLLTKTVTPSVAGPGTNLTYTLVVTNEGPSIVTDVTVTDSIPSEVNFISSSTTVGTTSYSSGQVIANVGILTNNTSATITVRVGTSAAAGVTNSAFLGFAEGNLNTDDNFASAVASVVNAAQRTLSIQTRTDPPSILITWPASSANFQLQVNTNLANSNGWQSLEFTPTLVNGLDEYSNAIPTGDAYFRLYAP